MKTLLPIGTLVLGAVLGYIGEWFRWRREIGREQHTRFDADKRRVYAELLAAALQFNDVRRRLLDLTGDMDEIKAALEGGPEVPEHRADLMQADLNDIAERYERADQRLTEALSVLILIAPKAVVDATWKLAVDVRSQMDADALAHVIEGVSKAARADLGIND